MERRDDWEMVRKWLLKCYEWGLQWPKRKGKRGRAKGGMVLDIKKELWDERERMEVENEGGECWWGE